MTEAPEDHPAGTEELADDQSVEPSEDQASAAEEALRTGDPRVDEVLGSMDRLHDLPVGEHAAVFEAAHEQLRAALEPDRDSA